MGLIEDQKADLTAIAWIGRRTFDPAECGEARQTAYDAATISIEGELMGMPHLAENLEAGLQVRGVDVTSAAEDLL